MISVKNTVMDITYELAESEDKNGLMFKLQTLKKEYVKLMSGILHLEKSWIFLIKIGLFKFVISIGRRTNVEIGWRFKT